ncbi:hypothetical protein Hanom_Chr05g00452041 [Helianthus anomalus]
MSSLSLLIKKTTDLLLIFCRYGPIAGLNQKSFAVGRIFTDGAMSFGWLVMAKRCVPAMDVFVAMIVGGECVSRNEEDRGNCKGCVCFPNTRRGIKMGWAGERLTGVGEG